MINPKTQLFAITTVATAVFSLGIYSVANSRSPMDMSTSIAKEQGGMNHGGMNHGEMNHNGMMKQSGGMTHNMDVGPADANYDLRFVDSMIPHHQGALVMAQEVLAKSKRPELIKLAKSIISDQQQEITQMQQWRKQWYPQSSDLPVMWHTAMKHEMPMTAEHKEMMQMNMSLGKADAQFDKRFLDAMIPHHQGAVTMAKDALQKSQRPEMQKFAKSVITSQQKEIDMMTQWRNKWYAKK